MNTYMFHSHMSHRFSNDISSAFVGTNLGRVLTYVPPCCVDQREYLFGSSVTVLRGERRQSKTGVRHACPKSPRRSEMRTYSRGDYWIYGTNRGDDGIYRIEGGAAGRRPETDTQRDEKRRIRKRTHRQSQEDSREESKIERERGRAAVRRGTAAAILFVDDVSVFSPLSPQAAQLLEAAEMRSSARNPSHITPSHQSHHTTNATIAEPVRVSTRQHH